MGGKPRVDGSPEQKWQIVQGGIKRGKLAETRQRYGIPPNLFYRWKDQAEQGAKVPLRVCARDCERKLRSIAVSNLATGFRRLDLALNWRERSRRDGAPA